MSEQREGGLAPVNWGLEIGLGVQIPINMFNGFRYYYVWKLKVHKE